MHSKPRVVIITGPTASGKTGYLHDYLTARSYGQLLKNYLVINADTRLFYQGFDIGTAKPEQPELDRFHYQLVDFLSAGDTFNAFQFTQKIKNIVDHPNSDGKTIFIIGGATFYLDVIINGLPSHPIIDPQIRSDLEAEHLNYGLTTLLRELKESDPAYYEEVDIHNPRRVLRALEIIRSGITFSELRKNREKLNLDLKMITLMPPREILNKRIAQRVDEMFNAGWIKEVEGLLKKYSNEMIGKPSIIGYSEIVNFLTKNINGIDKNGQFNLEELKNAITTKTRQLAKRQITWMKKNSTGYLVQIGYNKELVSSSSKLDSWMENFSKQKEDRRMFKMTDKEELFKLIDSCV